MSTSSPSVNGFLGGAGGTAKNSKVPINHLDYDYVRKCSNAKELEEIINVLRCVLGGVYQEVCIWFKEVGGYFHSTNQQGPNCVFSWLKKLTNV